MAPPWESGPAGETSGRMRASYVRFVLEPLAAACFREMPEVRSLTVGFVQEWRDEAEDAVHEVLVPSEDLDPHWVRNPMAMPMSSSGGRDVEALRGRLRLPRPDANDDLIVAFASCCGEAEGRVARSGAWAIVRRGPSGSGETTVLGSVLRPEWEDRRDVGPRRTEPLWEPVERDEPFPLPPGDDDPAERAAWLRKLFGR